MLSFLIALAVLILGYVLYGGLMTRIAGQDPKRPTPVQTRADGVDYIPLRPWKIFLIQFLNIAGLGPIFGAIMGVMYGPAAFLWIALGTIFAGAVHDYLSGMMSVRMGGASLPAMVGSQLGGGVRKTLNVFTILLLTLVGAVFVYNPADLLAGLTPEHLDRTFWVAVILLYFVAATLLPIDKIIGKIYPIFGFALLFMAAGIMVGLVVHHADMPEIWEQMYNHKPNPELNPVFPMMFVTIACGAISGFHATQSPLMARCLTNERYAKPVFYGAMVAEGVVALIWAAAAITFCHGYDALQEALAGGSPAPLVNDISVGWLGTVGGVLAIIGVIAAPITSGDTALRSCRLIVAEAFGVDQKKILKRLIISLPLFAITFAIMLLPYDVMWRYFAWCNQVLSVFTLWTLTVWLARARHSASDRRYLVTLLPALFMTMVTVSYIVFAPEGLGIVLQGWLGVHTAYLLALFVGFVVCCAFLAIFRRCLKSNNLKPNVL